MSGTFGSRLKALRTGRGLSQEEFAALLGTSKQVISRYETNQRSPKVSVANDYAKKLLIPLSYLLDGITENEKPATIIDDELDGLNDRERELFARFRLASPAVQELVLRALEPGSDPK